MLNISSKSLMKNYERKWQLQLNFDLESLFKLIQLKYLCLFINVYHKIFYPQTVNSEALFIKERKKENIPWHIDGQVRNANIVWSAVLLDGQAVTGQSIVVAKNRN